MKLEIHEPPIEQVIIVLFLWFGAACLTAGITLFGRDGAAYLLFMGAMMNGGALYMAARLGVSVVD